MARLILPAALFASCAPAVGSGPTAAPSPSAHASGVYVYQPTPFIWELVTLVDGRVANGAGAVFEWSCTGRRWAIGMFPAMIDEAYLRFGDERFAVTAGVPAAPWRLGDDPRSLPAPVCDEPTPPTKTTLSPDAARELIKQRVTAIGSTLVPSGLPDGLSADVDARADTFNVTYVGPGGIRITLGTVAANPQPPQPDGMQQRLLFRTDPQAFYQELDGRPTTLRTLLWREIAGTTSVPYALTAEGLTKDEFWKIARSLQ